MGNAAISAYNQSKIWNKKWLKMNVLKDGGIWCTRNGAKWCHRLKSYVF